MFFLEGERLQCLIACDPQRVKHWQVSTFRQRMGYLCVMHLIAGLILVGMTWQSTSWPLSTVWLAYLVAAWIGGALLFLWSTDKTRAIDNPGRALRMAMLATLAWSSPWICAAGIFSDADPVSRLVLLGLLTLLAASTTQAIDVYFPATAASLTCLLLPAAAFLGNMRSRLDVFLCIFLVTFYFQQLAIGFRNSRATLERGCNLLSSESAIERLNEQLTLQTGTRSKLEQALSLAKQACLDKSRFLAAASHDLRQPMHAISLFVAALKSESFESRSKYLLERLERSLDGLDNLFNRLLDISRLDAGLITPSIKTVDACTLAQTLEAQFMPLAASKSLRFKVRCQHDLQLCTDPELLSEVISNLLSNAFRYTEQGGVLLSMRARGEHGLIQVWDTGCGIPDHHLELIFDEFVQLNNPARDRRKGLGLGLAIVKRLTDALGHPVTTRSQPGRGSTFSLEVPRANGDYVNYFEAVHATMPNCALDGTLILVVDDEIDILAAMEAILASWGCHTILARSPDEAAKYVNASLRFPDVIITDHRLEHNLTSFDVAEALAPLLPCEIPMVVISGESNPSLEGDINEKGWLFMNKPVNATRLYAAVSCALENAPHPLSEVA